MNTCPLCKSKEVQKKYEKLYKCNMCKLEYLEDYDKNRSEIYNEEYWVDETNVKILECKEENFKQIIKHIPKGKSVLDYGGGYGSFYNYMKNKGYEIDVYEPYLLKKKLKKKKYDVITLFDVLEHVPNPIEMFNELKKMLNENGIIIIITPDTGEISNKIFSEKWPHYKYEHVLLYNRNSVKKLSEMVGMEIIKMENIKYNYNIEYIEEYSKKYPVYGFRNIKFPLKKYFNWVKVKNPLNKELLIILKK